MWIAQSPPRISCIVLASDNSTSGTLLGMGVDTERVACKCGLTDREYAAHNCVQQIRCMYTHGCWISDCWCYVQSTWIPCAFLAASRGGSSPLRAGLQYALACLLRTLYSRSSYSGGAEQPSCSPRTVWLYAGRIRAILIALQIGLKLYLQGPLSSYILLSWRGDQWRFEQYCLPQYSHVRAKLVKRALTTSALSCSFLFVYPSPQHHPPFHPRFE